MAQKKSTKDKTNLKPLNYEQVYRLIDQKKWSDLIRLAHDYSIAIPSDDMLDNAFKVFESEFFRGLENSKENQVSFKDLSQLYLMHTLKIFQLQNDNFKIVCIELTNSSLANGEIETAYNYAKQFPQEEVCAKVIQRYEDSLPKVVEHSQSKNIRVTENKEVSSTSYLISLFKSNQEHDFFMAVREEFPMYIVYPNVAVSCLINFNEIKKSLSQEETQYFFTSIIDCVVFDQHKNYLPIKFFELDSSLHDQDKQKEKDRIKDRIFALAGQTLYRIRKESPSQGKNEFMQLIRELFQE